MRKSTCTQLHNSAGEDEPSPEDWVIACVSLFPMATDKPVVEAVVRACQLLRAFCGNEVLTLKELAGRTGLSKTTSFRILQSLANGGLVARVGRGAYGCRIQPLGSPPYVLGFAAQATDSEFSRDVSESIQRVSGREQIRLIAVNNCYSAKTALRNADQLIKEGVSLVLEFQTYEHVAPIISSKFLEAQIPVIAIEIPHPGAIYFGADNYQAGVIGGRALGRWAKRHWDGQVDELLLLELPIAGALPQLRVTGTVAGLSGILANVESIPTVHLNSRGEFETSLELVRRHINRAGPKRTLIAAINDPSALGALRAFEEAGRSHLCAAIGQNAIREARRELRRPGTRLIGSVGYFPERYGEELVPLALAILHKKPVPSTVFVKHELITPRNIDLIYPPQIDSIAQSLD